VAIYSAEWGTSSPVLLTMGPDVPHRYVIQGDHRNEIISLLFFVFLSFFNLLFVLWIFFISMVSVERHSLFLLAH
jgi:hypothetical protein